MSEPAHEPGAEPTDAALLRAHVEGDPEAFGRLVARHRDRLWAVALRTTGHREEAADALQDALVSAFRRAGSFRGDAAVTTWLHRVVVNACLDRMRRSGVRRADPLPDDLDDRPDVAAPTNGPAAGDPERRVLAAEVRDRVHDALRQLPEEQRTCLVLVDLEEWSVADVAARLGVPVGTVKSRCHRGRARLAALLPDLVAPDGTHDGTHGGSGASHSSTRSSDRPSTPTSGGEQP